jgi:hypothetical protein
MSSMPILQMQTDSAMFMMRPKRRCLFFGESNLESLIPDFVNSEMDFLDTLTAATMIGPSKDPLPASSTPHTMLLLPANSNPLIPNQDIVAILSLPRKS